jgi:hypothetical protein
MSVIVWATLIWTQNPVQTTEKTLDLVEELMQRGSCGVTELADGSNMGKGMVYNHLTTPRKHGYVVKVGDEYRLGLKFLEVGGHIRKSMMLYEVAEPDPLRKLSLTARPSKPTDFDSHARAWLTGCHAWREIQNTVPSNDHVSNVFPPRRYHQDCRDHGGPCSPTI